MINIRFIIHLLGRLILIESAFLMLCSLIALLYGENDAMAFIYAALITLTAGSIMGFLVKANDRILAKKDGYFIVSVVWIIFSFFGCLPYLLGGTIPSFPDAFFESMSGFSTTGSSILNNVEAMPHATLFWRSLTQWLGGLGIIVLFVAILPSLGIEGRDLYVAEVTGPTHTKTSATFTASARNLWLIYTILTLIQAILLACGDMNLFDSICHSFTTMSTGGFSTKQASIAYWDSRYIQYVLTLFMFVGGINFSLFYAAIRGNWKKLYNDNEFRLYLYIVLFTGATIAVWLYLCDWGNFEKSFRDAMFQVVTLMTSTGYATADYQLWPTTCLFVLFLLMFIGASAGSTAGGAKVIRILLLSKNAFIELKKIIHPNCIINVKYNNKSVHPNIMSNISGFLALFVVIFCIGSFVMSFFTEDLATACSAVMTCLSNVGPGFGSIGPMDNFAQFNDFAKIFLSILMLVGRLEIFTIMVLFTKGFWQK